MAIFRRGDEITFERKIKRAKVGVRMDGKIINVRHKPGLYRVRPVGRSGCVMVRMDDPSITERQYPMLFVVARRVGESWGDVIGASQDKDEAMQAARTRLFHIDKEFDDELTRKLDDKYPSAYLSSADPAIRKRQEDAYDQESKDEWAKRMTVLGYELRTAKIIIA